MTVGGDTWTVWLPINKEGRFPQVDSIVRPQATALSRWTLAKSDAEFLLPRLDDLPGRNAPDRPITLGLNGHVALRASGDEQPRPLELTRTNSSTSGDPASVHMNRSYLARALRLGFDQFACFGPGAAIQCHDDRRTYLWMGLEAEKTAGEAIDPVRIESPAASAGVSVHRPRAREKTMPRNTNAPTESSMAGAPATRSAIAEGSITRSPIAQSSIPESTNMQNTMTDDPAASRKSRQRSAPAATAKTPFVQAIALRDTLHAAAKLANELAREFKHQNRQNKVFKNTLESLKSLQKMAS